MFTPRRDNIYLVNYLDFEANIVKSVELEGQSEEEVITLFRDLYDDIDCGAGQFDVEMIEDGGEPAREELSKEALAGYYADLI